MPIPLKIPAHIAVQHNPFDIRSLNSRDIMNNPKTWPLDPKT